MLPLMPSQPTPVPQGPAPDMLSMLGAGPSIGNPTDLSGALAGAIRQFEQMQSMILELARSFPGSEDAARQMLDGLERWRQQLVVGMTPPSAGMPGAQGMMA
jgi:hypothetical protein